MSEKCQEATSDEIAANVFLLDLSKRLGNIQYSFSNNRGLGQLGPLRASRGVRTRFTLRRHHGTTHPSACDAGKPSAASITQFHWCGHCVTTRRSKALLWPRFTASEGQRSGLDKSGWDCGSAPGSPCKSRRSACPRRR